MAILPGVGGDDHEPAAVLEVGEGDGSWLPAAAARGGKGQDGRAAYRCARPPLARLTNLCSFHMISVKVVRLMAGMLLLLRV
jgi:hypothetical protein